MVSGNTALKTVHYLRPNEFQSEARVFLTCFAAVYVVSLSQHLIAAVMRARARVYLYTYYILVSRERERCERVCVILRNISELIKTQTQLQRGLHYRTHYVTYIYIYCF